MSRADGKAERDRIEAERAVREAIAAKQAAAQSSSVPKRPAETTAERHRRIAEKTREAFAELDEKMCIRDSPLSAQNRVLFLTACSLFEAFRVSVTLSPPRPAAQFLSRECPQTA